MRFIVIVLSVTALVLASGAGAQNPSNDQQGPQQERAEIEHPGWYREKAPYRPCPAVAAINGRNICLGCPSRCPFPPKFGVGVENNH
jgi:hypothetical protein